MATTPIILSTGSSSGAGTADEGRNDLVIGETVSLSDTEPLNVGASYVWVFEDIPIGSSTVMINSTTATPSFVPDINGSYRVRCTVDGTYVSVEVLAVPLPVSGGRIPSFEEELEYDESGNAKGWHYSMSLWMRSIDDKVGISSSFTFREGASTTGPGVYSSWSSLYSALSAARATAGGNARFEIVFDDTVTQPCVIPSGAYDMTNVVWRGLQRPGQFGRAQVDISEGATFTKLFEFDNIDVTNKATATAPVTLVNEDTIILKNGADISSLAPNAVEFFDATGLTAAQYITLRLFPGTSIGARGQTYDTINVAANALMLAEVHSAAALHKNTVRSGAGAVLYLSAFSNDSLFGPQTDWTGTIDYQFGTTPFGPRYRFDPDIGAAVLTGATTLSLRAGFVRADVSGGAFQLTMSGMPNASFNNRGRPVTVKEVSGTAGLTVAPAVGETIDGSSSAVSVPPGGAVTFIPDGIGAWWTMGSSGGNVMPLSVANIDDPSTELNAISGSVKGDTRLVYQTVAGTDQWTLYVWDDADSGAEAVPFKVDGLSGMWNALAGKYIHNEATTNFSVAGVNRFQIGGNWLRSTNAGTAATPFLATTAAPTTGLYAPATGEFGVSTGGLQAVRWDASQNTIFANDIYLSATKKIYFDGFGGNDYLYGAVANSLYLFLNSSQIFSFFTSGGTFGIPLIIQKPSVGIGEVAGLTLQNLTAAGSGTPQYSPMHVLEGRGYETGSPSSQAVKSALQTYALEGAANPTAVLTVKTSIANVSAGAYVDMAKFINDGANRSLAISEVPAAPADTAGWGQVWVKNDTPNTLWFTDDAGTDWQLGASGGGTLDAAYDFGGAGAGRAIVVDSGAITLTQDNLLNTEVANLEIINSTAATAINKQQNSPGVIFEGHGWDNGGAADNVTRWKVFNDVLQKAGTTPEGWLTFQHQLGVAAYATIFAITNNEIRAEKPFLTNDFGAASNDPAIGFQSDTSLRAGLRRNGNNTYLQSSTITATTGLENLYLCYGTSAAFRISNSSGAICGTVNNGSVSAASLFLGNDFDTGLYVPATGYVGVVGAGTAVARLGSSQLQMMQLGSATTPAIARDSDDDTGIFWVNPNIIGVSTFATEAIRWNASQQTLVPDGTAALPSYAFTAAPTTGFSNPTNQLTMTVSGITYFQASSNQIRIYMNELSPGGDYGPDLGNGSRRWDLCYFGNIFHQPKARTSGALIDFNYTAPAHTGLTASTEVPSMGLDMSAVKTWATGNITNQRFVKLDAPTIAFAGASTVTSAATFYVSGAPIAGTNATLTNTYAMWVDSGISRFDGNVDCQADIDAAGGMRRTMDGVWLNSPATSTTYTMKRDGDLTGGPDDKGWFVPARAGSVVELSVWVDADVASGQIDFWIESSTDGGDTFSNLWGSSGTPIFSLDGTTNPEVNAAAVAKDANTFSAGHVLRVRAATNGAFSAGRRVWASLVVEC